MSTASGDANREPYASTEELQEELDKEFSTEQLERFLRRAVRLITDRIPKERDESHLRELEILVGAHFAYPIVTGAASGRQVSRIEQESATLSFKTLQAEPEEYTSPFWEQAVMIDPRLKRGKEGVWSVSVG